MLQLFYSKKCKLESAFERLPPEGKIKRKVKYTRILSGFSARGCKKFAKNPGKWNQETVMLHHSHLDGWEAQKDEDPTFLQNTDFWKNKKIQENGNLNNFLSFVKFAPIFGFLCGI